MATATGRCWWQNALCRSMGYLQTPTKLSSSHFVFGDGGFFGLKNASQSAYTAPEALCCGGERARDGPVERST